MEFWVDVENSAGVKQGAGPITTGLAWQQIRRLNRAGEFRFTLPATDTRAATLLTAEMIVRCYAVIDGVVTAMGAGIVNEQRLIISAGDAVLEVTGGDLLRELSYEIYDIRTGIISTNTVHRTITSLSTRAWKLTGQATLGTAVNARFFGESLLSALVRLAETVGEYFRNAVDVFVDISTIVGGGSIVTVTTSTDHGLIVGDSCAIVGNGIYSGKHTVLSIPTSASFTYAATTTGSDNSGSVAYRQIEWIGPSSNFDASGITAMANIGNSVAAADNTAICHIVSISELEDSWGLINTARIYGAGDGETALTLASVSKWPDGTAVSWAAGADTQTINGRQFTLYQSTSQLVDDTSKTTSGYGTHAQTIQFPDIGPISNSASDMAAAADALLANAYYWMIDRSVPKKFYDLSVTGLHQLLYPGQTIDVEARRYVNGEKPINISATLNILEAEITLDANGLQTSRLTVTDSTRWPDGDSGMIVQAIRDSAVSRLYPQQGPSNDTISYSEIMGDDGASGFVPAYLYFWLGAEVATVQQALLRFRINSLRSTVTAVGDTGSTVDSGGSSAPTTTATDSHNHSIAAPGSMFFEVPIYHDGAAPGDNVTYDHSSGHLFYTGTDVGTPDADTYLKTPAYTTTSDGESSHGHTVTIAAHSHPFTPSISLTYGVFEESGANTLEEGDLAYTVSVDGGAASSDLGASVSSAGNGWYALDITSEVANADTSIPLGNAFVIEISTATAKTASIRAQLLLRTTIQSIATV